MQKSLKFQGKFPQNGGDCKGNPLISGKSRLVKHYDLPMFYPLNDASC